jgi:hypothetical protein
LPTSLAKGDASMFSPPSSWCPKLTAAQRGNAVREQLTRLPEPASHRVRLKELQGLLGTGVAPPITTITDTVSDDGYWMGGSLVGSNWIEAALLQYGAGLPMMYGRLTPEDLYRCPPSGGSNHGTALSWPAPCTHDSPDSFRCSPLQFA